MEGIFLQFEYPQHRLVNSGNEKKTDNIWSEKLFWSKMRGGSTHNENGGQSESIHAEWMGFIDFCHLVLSDPIWHPQCFRLWHKWIFENSIVLIDWWLWWVIVAKTKYRFRLNETKVTTPEVFIWLLYLKWQPNNHIWTKQNKTKTIDVVYTSRNSEQT